MENNNSENNNLENNNIENNDIDNNDIDNNDIENSIEEVNEDTNFTQKTKNSIIQTFNENGIKPFFGVIIALIIILLTYYFFWRSIAVKTKSIVVESLSGFDYESVSVSGFPFYKTIKINNINFGNDVPVITQNNVLVENIKISSLIFGTDFEITLKNISITTEDGSKYELLYNTTPKIAISFYPDGTIKKFEYNDYGYRVIDKSNITLYTAGDTSFKIETIQNNDTFDYSFVGNFKDMQNLSLVNSTSDIDPNIIPEIFNLNFDISSSLTKNRGVLDSYIIKINDFNLIGNNNNGFQLSGEIIKDNDDIYSYGNLKFTLLNYKDFLFNLKKNILEALNLEETNKLINKDNKNNLLTLTNNVFKVLEKTIKLNTETTDSKGIITFTKKKNMSDYLINGNSLYGIMQDIYRIEK